MEFEQAENLLQSLSTLNRQAKTAAAAARYPNLRVQFESTSKRLSEVMTKLPACREKDQLTKSISSATSEFRRAASKMTSVNETSAAQASSGVQQKQQQVSSALLATEERYQKERLEGIVELEASATELKGMMSDARDLIVQQQEGLNVIGDNVQKSISHVRAGTKEITAARRMQ